jgi:preprotein translocase subunit SecD
VEGWQRIQVERSNHVVWLSPIEAVTAADIEKAAPDHTSAEGQTRVAVVFTDAGAKHFADLTTGSYKNRWQ